jgi:hypothetical protein
MMTVEQHGKYSGLLTAFFDLLFEAVERKAQKGPQ